MTPVQDTKYEAGLVTGSTQSGDPVQDPTDVGTSAFDFMQVDAATQQASIDDPYYGVYSSDGTGCSGTEIQCDVRSAPASAAATSSRSADPKSRHGIGRKGIRALLENADEVGRSAEGNRRFVKRKGSVETTFSIDPSTELLVAEETTEPGHQMTVKHKWKRLARGYVRERSEVDDVEMVDGKRHRSRATIEILNVRVK